MENKNVYIVMCDDVDKMNLFINSFITRELAWEYILEQAEQKYDFTFENQDENDVAIVKDFERLSLCGIGVYYSIHETVLQ